MEKSLDYFSHSSKYFYVKPLKSEEASESRVIIIKWVGFRYYTIKAHNKLIIFFTNFKTIEKNGRFETIRRTIG
jgi:hypothetical protein